MTQTTRHLPIARAEFIALMAMMFATIAFSIDAMLPAMPDIATQLTPLEPTRATLIITSFVLGMGIGTFFAGPLSDAFGRRNIMFLGAGLYIAAAAVAWASQSLELMLIARVFQGIGASGPRVVCIAIVRDLFSGREMARILSIVMIIFTIVPAFAPAMGVVIIHVAGWRSIFLAFVIFSLISAVWLGLRLPETLPVENRRPLKIALIVDAVRQMLQHPVVRISIMVQTLSMAMLFSLLMLIQPVYQFVFDKLETFPFWFGAIALSSALSSFLNAMLVVRFGMRRLITIGLAMQIGLSTLVLMTSGSAAGQGFAVFAIWQAFVFFQAGLSIGNLNAIAMEPMGHIAGMAASVIGAISTVLAAVIASPVGLLFDGTIRPLVGTILVLALLAFLLMMYMARVEARAQSA
ncbi:MFS transporter [Roseobacter denitrificans]|uniref:MFS permease protein, putative n=1 Tax=Roseobacter denitrificans (strain ATCC 33942 / OCh 114) TaxID=375451 RepID=Q165R5_ROSDO|nr:MFS transporter [Roseobacter denitrificans]ABG32278.1 MFS permease protein, putative [Roseobacter denitrificans OCh 114]SFF79728.1 MFS transporter, DHA1 family, bicyclomycin/chloramphenicol resistance protein [Roseobacter denitrificans OCh 114]